MAILLKLGVKTVEDIDRLSNDEFRQAWCSDYMMRSIRQLAVRYREELKAMDAPTPEHWVALYPGEAF